MASIVWGSGGDFVQGESSVSLEITKECYKQYCDINGCIYLSQKCPWGWFLASEH